MVVANTDAEKEKTRIDPRAFNWTISVDTPLRASDSNIYFLWWVSEANNEEGFTSGYFNITGAAPSTTDVSSATTPVSTNTNNAPTTPAPPTPTPPNPASPVPPPAAAGNSDSSALRIGLGVGLGVGIPIVILLAVGVFFMLKYLKRLTPAKPKDAAAVENEPLDKYTYGHVADQQEIDGYAAAAVTPYDPPSELPGGGTLSGRSELPER
ncbi:hypothetical protein BDV95DRAFT_578695 [Massariosphaeria phaeospora]|uniref:Mid2 domain-containing protein n=1 Tax=Massariosphaeria phaeospora TaxID=100035 RepID=A0A7C8IAN1_9PLEO|nr:hypothetical protein BDV95DRAFT_578695 [Massariosphaeria phaeospora]